MSPSVRCRVDGRSHTGTSPMTRTPKLHYEDGGPRCGRPGETTDRKRSVTCAVCRKQMNRKVNYMTQADSLFSKLIRERDGRCRADGYGGFECAGVLQCAHVITRSYKTIRTHPDNAVALCAAHHTYFTWHPLEWRDWVEAWYPGRWDYLATVARSYERVDWKVRVEELKRGEL